MGEDFRPTRRLVIKNSVANDSGGSSVSKKIPADVVLEDQRSVEHVDVFPRGCSEALLIQSGAPITIDAGPSEVSGGSRGGSRGGTRGGGRGRGLGPSSIQEILPSQAVSVEESESKGSGEAGPFRSAEPVRGKRTRLRRAPELDIIVGTGLLPAPVTPTFLVSDWFDA